MATTVATVERDRSVDVLRGALVVLLVLVEYLPPSPGYTWLRHSPWDGIRIADVVFPGFLFVVGASMAVGRGGTWGRTLRRLALLLGLGLLFNAFTDVSPLRWTGVLQAIGISGFIAWSAVRFLVRRPSDGALVAGGLLLVHGLVLSRAFDIDRWVVPDAHLYREGTAGHDPEGVLMCLLGAPALVLLGWTATRLRSWPFALSLLGCALVAWTVWEPNKRAWTPTFTLLVAGGFAVALLLLRPVPVPIPVLGAIGRNALLVYVGQHAVRELVLDDPPSTNLLGYALAATVAWSAAAVLLGRVGVRLRV